MKHLKKIFVAALAFFAVACNNSEQSLSYDYFQSGVTITFSDNSGVKVDFYLQDAVRITKWTSGGKSDKHGLCVTANPVVKKIFSCENEDFLTLKSEQLIVNINKTNGNVSFFNSDSLPIINEMGTPYFKDITAFDDKGYTVAQQFSLMGNQALYGLGQHQEGFMNYRGKELLLSQSNVNAVNPVLVSTDGYGIFWDNYSLTKFTNTNPEVLTIWSEMGDNIDYYFMGSNNIDGVISIYRKLTGKAQNLPVWAFGYWQSKERYKTQNELLTVAKRYDIQNIPLDCMVQDWEWWEPGKWSGMEFDSTRYPNPKLAVDALHAMNVHTMISVWPCIGVESPMYRDMLSKGFLYEPLGWGNFRYVDVYNPEAMKLYCQYLNKGVKSKGFDAWWLDSTEPDVMNALTKESHQYEMKRMKPNYLGSFTRYLNPYVLVMLDYINKDWRNDSPEKRTVLLTRSAFAGLQRNGAIPWSGDIGASWEIFQHQISAGLNLCMSGIPFWTFDIGSFLIGSYEGVFTYGAKDPAYQEYYTRMFQFGTFTPIFRSHGSDAPREMWEIPQYKNVLVEFDKIRYSLMPYIYSVAIRCAVDDYTIMRGLAMDFKDDAKVYNINNQYMFGENIMVCPVTNYMYNTPPQISTLVPPEVFKTNDGKPGISAKYYNDNKFSNLTRECIDSQVDAYWYTGRPEYVTDSMYSVHWEGKIVAPETGKYQFQIKSFDSRLIVFNGDTLKIELDGNEPYYQFLNLEKGKEYPIICETVNHQTGAARFRLFWKTPKDFERENQKSNQPKTRMVYLPEGSNWVDFFTGKTYQGGTEVEFEAPINRIPVLIKCGAILPMSPEITRANQIYDKDLEIRIFPGADGVYTLYEDAGDGFEYENGEFSKITFRWNNSSNTLTILNREGNFKGMKTNRKFKIVKVDQNIGLGSNPVSDKNAKIVDYNGSEIEIKL